MAFTTAEGEVIIFLLFLAVLFLAGLYYLRKRFSERARQLKGEIAESTARVEERAHNQIVLDEAELATLAREGFDTDRAKGFLNDARSAFDRRDFHHALQIGQSVHDSLVRMRRAGALTTTSEGSAASASVSPGGFEVGVLGPDGPSGPEPEPSSEGTGGKPPLPKNRMESRFQITLLTEELIEAVRARPDDARVAEANRLAAEAKALEQRSEYTDALRVALKARRGLGGKVETLSLGAGPATGRAEPNPFAAGETGGLPVGGAANASRPGPGTTSGTGSMPGFGECARCHRPLRQGDAFCRSCGAAVAPAKCPRCGAVIEPDDRFCPRCGSPST